MHVDEHRLVVVGKQLQQKILYKCRIPLLCSLIYLLKYIYGGKPNILFFNKFSTINIHNNGSVTEVHHPVCILALGSGQRLLYPLGSGLGLVLVLVRILFCLCPKDM